MTPARPLKQGKSTEAYEPDLAAYHQQMRAQFSELARAKRLRFIELGIQSYEWLAMDVHGTCEVAAQNGGKKFSCAVAPPEGHVGEGKCGSPDWCRCTATPVVEF